ncbi:MAG: RNA polymerase sigma factor [Blastocatellia bacterium]|nr:RNA polymerase sigma factor [Blastocatellia bacterium]
MKERSPPSELEERFNAILDKYGDYLRNAIAQVCPKDLGIEIGDIEQEARLRLWRAIESEREILHPGSYIYKIAVSTTLNAIRRAKNRREEQLRFAEDDDSEGQIHPLTADPGLSPEALAERNELIGKVERALDRLPENRRLAVGLYLKGMTTAEIAEFLDWTEAKARNLAYRGLNDLREQLRAEGIEYDG